LAEDVRQTLTSGKHLTPTDHREMIRVVAREIHNQAKRPGRKLLLGIADKMVSEYPLSLKDAVGPGSYATMKKLEAAIENMNRMPAGSTSQRSSNLLKADNSIAALSTDVANPGKSLKRKVDVYGYANANPLSRPEGETEESEAVKKQEMIRLWNEAEFDGDGVTKLMSETYFGQRKTIRETKSSVLVVSKDWPFIFHNIGMKVHYQELMGSSLNDICINMEKKRETIIAYMKKQTNNKGVQKAYQEMQHAKSRTGSCQPELMGIVHLLVSYFKEESDKLFLVKEVFTFAFLNPILSQGDF